MSVFRFFSQYLFELELVDELKWVPRWACVGVNKCRLDSLWFIEFDGVSVRVDLAAAIAAALLLGLLVAERLAARVDQIIAGLLAPRALGAQLCHHQTEQNILTNYCMQMMFW